MKATGSRIATAALATKVVYSGLSQTNAGSNARFHAVTWRGDIGIVSGFHYHENVASAFVTSPLLAGYLNSLPDGNIVMAHSLGNMVAAEAIARHDAQVDKLLMLNAAIPSEAFELFAGTPHSVQGAPEWGRFAWHKQEVHKGRGALDPAGTSWAGWGFAEIDYTLAYFYTYRLFETLVKLGGLE